MTDTPPALARCGFDTDLRSKTSGQRLCAGAGSMPACQLCPDSPRHWRSAPASPQVPVTPVSAEPVGWGVMLTIEKGWTCSVYEAANPRPCSICGQPAMMRSPSGVPTHRTCAEAQATQ